MSILEAKIELARMVLDIEDESLIEQVKNLISFNQEEEGNSDFPSHIKESVIKSIAQADSGNTISLEKFKQKHFSKR
jgi:chaperonin GroEL (HSP60 family)